MEWKQQTNETYVLLSFYLTEFINKTFCFVNLFVLFCFIFVDYFVFKFNSIECALRMQFVFVCLHNIQWFLFLFTSFNSNFAGAFSVLPFSKLSESNSITLHTKQNNKKIMFWNKKKWTCFEIIKMNELT